MLGAMDGCASCNHAAQWTLLLRKHIANPGIAQKQQRSAKQHSQHVLVVKVNTEAHQGSDERL